MNNKYDDIIHLPHHVSQKRPKMSLHDRAAQFAPFAALTGYGDAVEETARHTDEKGYQSDDEVYRLDLILRSLHSLEHLTPTVGVTYFCHDERKSGGKYISEHKSLYSVDVTKKALVFTDKSEIPFCDVVNIELPEKTD